ncbi:unnamed protein product [Rhizophagus irregularis]|nr:unnamed protein product [Rhizophagus irregularis]
MDELIFVYSGSCSSLLRNLSSIGTTFVVVNCGGGTLDLTTRKLVGNNPLQLSEVTERSGDFCGSAFVDKEFIAFSAMDLLVENNYDEMK